jgi:hypothetical protein
LWTCSPLHNIFPPNSALQKPFSMPALRLLLPLWKAVKQCQKLLSRFHLQGNRSWCTCAIPEGPPFFGEQGIIDSILHITPDWKAIHLWYLASCRLLSSTTATMH